MKIDSFTTSSDLRSLQVDRPEVGNEGEGRKSNVDKSSDSVALSGTTAAVAAELAAEPAGEAARIEALRAEFEAGGLQDSAEAIANSLIDSALSDRDAEFLAG